MRKFIKTMTLMMVSAGMWIVLTAQGTDCGGNIILLPNPQNCSTFFQYSCGYWYTQLCPEGLYFCAEKEICTWSFEPGCSFNCILVDGIDGAIDGGTLPEIVIECDAHPGRIMPFVEITYGRCWENNSSLPGVTACRFSGRMSDSCFYTLYI